MKVIKVKKIGCGPCGRPQEALGRLLGGPRTRIPGAWGLPQGPQPIFLTFLTLMIFLTFMTFLSFLTFMTFMSFFDFYDFFEFFEFSEIASWYRGPRAS